MLGRTALVPAIALAAALAASAIPALAQCRLCENPTTERATAPAASEINLQVEASLDFDRLVMITPGEGSATLNPDGSRQVSGTIALISGRAMVGQARIRGEAGRAVRVELPNSIELHALGGGQIRIDDIRSDLPALPRLDSAGSLLFRFGGRLQVSGDAGGDYRGDIPITVEYL